MLLASRSLAPPFGADALDEDSGGLVASAFSPRQLRFGGNEPAGKRGKQRLGTLHDAALLGERRKSQSDGAQLLGRDTRARRTRRPEV